MLVVDFKNHLKMKNVDFIYSGKIVTSHVNISHSQYYFWV